MPTIVRAPFHRRSATLAAGILLSVGAVVAAAQPAYAVVLVPVPAGCGSYSGMLWPETQLDDFSAGPAVGDLLNGIPYIVPPNFGMITVGSSDADYIQGNAVDEIICGGAGDDWIRGNSGIDEIFGGQDADSIWGEEGGDILHGGPGRDTLYGDDPANSHPNTDLADDIHGGEQRDTMFGGAGNDTFAGGDNLNDSADGQAGADTCDPDVELGPC
jgi:Ca2+-binding RTX toxin-like protein